MLLAAGQSRRFGREDKLLAFLHGRPLVRHAAAAVEALGLARLIAVTNTPAVARQLGGWDIVAPAVQDPPQSASLAAGIAEALRLQASGVLLVLGDMPGVTAGHLQSVLSTGLRCRRAASTDGKRRMPPAWFPAEDFDTLLQVHGDRGGRAILKTLPPKALVRASASVLTDIDTPDALVACRNRGVANPPQSKN